MWQRKVIMGKKLSGAQKRKKKKEREKAVEEARADMERLKLGPTKLWTGLVLHHKDVFVSHVISKLNGTDRFFFSRVNTESRGVLAYAGVKVSGLRVNVHECTSISTLEWAWNHMPWGEKDGDGEVMDQAWFCSGVAATNKLEFLKWAREVKHCEWDEETINIAADIAPLDNWRCVAYARYYEHPGCENYLLEKGCPEPTDEEYADFVARKLAEEQHQP